MHGLIIEVHSEKCLCNFVVRQEQYNYTNLDGTAYYIPCLNGTFIGDYYCIGGPLLTKILSNDCLYF